jgi:hypothetical protein
MYKGGMVPNGMMPSFVKSHQLVQTLLGGGADIIIS